MIAYADTSALVKLIRTEEHSAAFRRWLIENDSGLVTSIVGRIELSRVATALGGDHLVRAQDLESGLTVLPLTNGVALISRALPVGVLRTLDAIHVASAVALGEDCDVLVTYDHRMAQAAESAGLRALSPGA